MRKEEGGEGKAQLGHNTQRKVLGADDCLLVPTLQSALWKYRYAAGTQDNTLTYQKVQRVKQKCRVAMEHYQTHMEWMRNCSKIFPSSLSSDTY